MTCTVTETAPMLADGVPFHLGMTVYLPVGGVECDGEIRMIETDPAKHEIDSFIHEGLRYNCLGLKGSRANTDIGFFFSCREAVLDARIARLEAELAERAAALATLRAERICGS